MRLDLNQFQENLLKFARLYPEHFYNLGLSFRLSKNLNPDLLYKACYHVVRSIEILHSVLLGDEKSGFSFETDNNAEFIFERKSISEDICLLDMQEFTEKAFYLTNQHPIRMKLYYLTDQSYILVVVFHHICIDGVSVVDFLSLIADTYNKFERGEQCINLEIPSWQNSITNLRSGNLELQQTELNYWKNLFVNRNMETIFPDVSSSSVGYEFQAEVFEIGEPLIALVNHAARQYKTTSFSFILAVWMFVLYRLTGQKQIYVDTPINRRPLKSKNLIGFFVNNSPFMADFDACQDVGSLMSELNQQRKQLKSLQRYPMSEIFREVSNNEGHITLGRATVGINFIGWSNSLEIPFENVECHFYRRLDHLTSLDLLLEVEPTIKGLSRVCYRSCFTKEYIEMLVSSFKEALCKFISISDLSKISLFPNDKQISLEHYYEKRLDELLPVEKSINEYFEQIAEMFPDKYALIYGDKSLTYNEVLEKNNLNALILRFAYNKHFNKVFPIGEPVGIYTENKLQAILWALAILRAGGAYVCLDIAYPKDRIAFIIEDCGIKVVLSDVKDAYNVIPTSTKLLNLLEEEVISDVETLPDVDVKTTAYIIYTSGTTGIPKGVPILHEQLLTMLKSGLFAEDENQRVLQFASLCFDASVWEIFGALLKGATLVIALAEQRLDIDLLINLLVEKQISSALIPPVLLSRFPHCDIPNLRNLLVGGDSISEQVTDYWKKGRMLYNVYGPTEVTVCSTFSLIDDNTNANDIGLPFIGVTCYVLDENLNLVPDYVHGELYIGGPQVTIGYINRPELNKEKFISNPFATERDKKLGRNLILYKSGDLVSRLPNGHILFHGRKDFQVKIHGFRIELGEIESMLNKYSGVAKCIVKVKDVSGDKRLVAYISVYPEFSLTVTDITLRTYLSENLPYYMIPSYWVFMESFPMTVNGKIDIKALPEPTLAKSYDNAYVSPVTLEECILERIIAEVCQMDRISVDDDLFNLGVSSIQIMIIIDQAANEGLELTVSEFYRRRTIRKIVDGCKSQFCFWANEYENHEEKPIMLLVCGDAYFNPDYQYFVRKFESEYSILVLDSYHTYFSLKSIIDWNTLINIYRRTMIDIIGKRIPQIVAGFCLGGEMALSLVQVFSNSDIKPTLLMLDSFANREKQNTWTLEYPESLGGMSKKLSEETATLLTTQEMYTYTGDVILYLANCFTTDRVKENDNKDIVERLYIQFKENASAWLKLIPHCQIHRIDVDHWHMLDVKSVDLIYEKFKLNSK